MIRIALKKEGIVRVLYDSIPSFHVEFHSDMRISWMHISLNALLNNH